MPSQETKTFAGEVLAAVCADLAFGRKRLGVFAENVPPIDPKVFLSGLATRTTRPARVALLGTTEKFGRTPAHLTVTTDPTEANQWRNDKIAGSGTPSIFIVLGPAEKLNSLRTAVPILTATDIRRAIIKRCLDLHDTHERKAFLEAIGSLTGEVSNSALAEFAAEVEQAAKNSKAMLLEAEPTLVYSLGLIPSKRLFIATSEPAARKAIRKNLDRVRALTGLSAKQTKTLANVAETPKHRLAGRAAVILKYAGSRKLADLRPLTLEEIDEVFAIDAPEQPVQTEPEPTRARRERIDGDALALDLVLRDRDGHGLKAAAKRYEQAVEPDPEGGLASEEFKVNGRTILPQVKTGAAQATTLFGALLSPDVWGGVVTSNDALDLVGAMKLAASGDAETEEFRPESEKGVRTLLKKAVERGIAPASALAAWDALVGARRALLPSGPVLINHPLLALADPRVLGHAKELLAAYSAAMAAVRDTAEKLRNESPQAARRLVASFLALDIAFIHARDEWSAVAAPTHPFHLWRWTSFHELLATHRDELREIGRETLEPLVTDPPAVCPQVVLSSFALKHDNLDRPRAFVAIGTFAALPQFAEPTARQHGKFRARELAKLAERLIRLMPHAALGLRVAVIDPPSVAGALDDLIDLPSPFDEDAIVPLHAVVLRTRAAIESTDEEDEAVATLARDLADHGGTLNVPTLGSSGRVGLNDAADYLSKYPVHIAVVFDPGVGERLSVPLASRPVLSPLVVPRAYRYDRFEDRLDLVVAGDAEPFSTYHDLFCASIDIPRDSFVGRRSGAFQSAKLIEHVARGSVWTIVVDQAIEPTLRIEGAPCIDWRTDGGRDLVTFTAHPETIENLMGDALRVAGLLPDVDSRKRMLNQLMRLSGEAVLGLARAKPGSTLAEPRIAKGMVGVLASVRWYLEQHPDAIVISLDEPTSRIWVLGVAEDDRHGDLLAVRPTDKGVLVEALEVKAHDDEAATVQEHGATIGGKAVVQVDQTIHAVRQILSKAPDSPVLRARQDILRDQLYRAVASRSYSPDVRGRLVSLLEELFSKGAHEVRGLIFRVKIAPGETQRDAAPDWKKSPRDNRVGLVRLTESGPPGKFRSPPPSATMASGVRDAASPPPESTPTKPKRGAAKGRAGDTAPASTAAAPTPAAVASRAAALRLLIGRSSGGDEVFWEPHRDGQPLNNFGMLITGDPGAGKTQMIKCVIAAVADQQLPICIFDFKNDYSDDAFTKKHGLRVHDVDRRGLPFNPLSLLPDATGEVQPIRQVHELTEILKRIYQLGARQTSKLKDAIVSAYERHGIKVSAWQRADAVQRVPDFNEVQQILVDDERNDGVLDRLSSLFDLNLFPDAGTAATTFEDLLRDRVVLDLHSLPNDAVKAAMSEFIIVRLHGHVIKGEQPRELRRLLVFDEAWRVKSSERLQELAREGRAFGVGIVIGTQFPGDIPENLAGNLATQLLLSNQDPDHRRTVVRTLIGATAGPDAARLVASLPHLQKHDGYFRNQHYPPYVLVNTIPYHKR
jgi:hypothetical protein